VRFRNFSHSALEIFGFGGVFLGRLDAFADAVLVRSFVDEDVEAFFRDEV
jgi:hypothetical protein